MVEVIKGDAKGLEIRQNDRLVYIVRSAVTAIENFDGIVAVRLGASQVFFKGAEDEMDKLFGEILKWYKEG